MSKGPWLLAVAGMAFGSAALAQPTADDLGPIGASSAVTTTYPQTGGLIRWFTFDLTVDINSGNWFEIETTGSTFDTEIGLYSSTGALIGDDDDSGPGLQSFMTFGAGSGRTLGGGAIAADGRDGPLAPGRYYIAACGFNSVFAADYNVTTTSGLTGTFVLGYGTSGPISAAGAFAGGFIAPGSTKLVTVVVTPGISPDSTGITASVDLTALGGASNAPLFDDGTNGDVTAGDNVFSRNVSIPAVQAGGPTGVPFSVRDAQMRSTAGNLVAEVVYRLAGTGSLTSISGNFTPSTTDVYYIDLCDPASFGATTVGGATVDTQLFLFNEQGIGIASNDDSQTTLQSTLTSLFTSSLSRANVYLAINRYNRDAVDASNALIWANTPLGTERAPDGPGASNPFSAWTGVTLGAATYTIALTGACYAGGTRCVADFDDGTGTGTPDGGVTIDDLLYYLGLYTAGNVAADVDNGTFTNTPDGGVTIDDLLYFLFRYSEGC